MLCSWRRFFKRRFPITKETHEPPWRPTAACFYLSTTVRNGLWPHTLWMCHKVIYKNTRDGDEFGPKKNHQSAIDPPSFIYPTPVPSQPKIVVPSDTTLHLFTTHQTKKDDARRTGRRLHAIPATGRGK